jgi:hypothetical protein
LQLCSILNVVYWQSTTDPLTNIVTPISAAQVAMLLVLTAGDIAAFYIAFGADFAPLLSRAHRLSCDSGRLSVFCFLISLVQFSLDSNATIPTPDTHTRPHAHAAMTNFRYRQRVTEFRQLRDRSGFARGGGDGDDDFDSAAVEDEESAVARAAAAAAANSLRIDDSDDASAGRRGENENENEREDTAEEAEQRRLSIFQSVPAAPSARTISYHGGDYSSSARGSSARGTAQSASAVSSSGTWSDGGDNSLQQ